MKEADTGAEKLALITGGSRGLGRALCRELASAGYRVLFLYSRDKANADELQKELHPAARGICLDIGAPDAAAAIEAVLRTETSRGKFVSALLINNASAPFEPRPLHLLSWEEFDRQIQIGLRGSLAAITALLRALPKSTVPHRTIVNVLTKAISGPMPKGFAAYAAAKASLRCLGRSVASEYGTQGVRVLSVSPGFMDTALTQAWDERIRKAVARNEEPLDTGFVAAEIRNLAENPEIPGQAEDYPIPLSIPLRP